MTRRQRYFLFAGGFFALYLATWYWFGVQYRRIANATSGKEFIFQQDIQLASHIARFKEEQKLSVMPDEILEEIIVNKDLVGYDDTYNAPIIPTTTVRIFDEYGELYVEPPTEKSSKSVEGRTALYSVRPMGSRWAAFYREKLKNKEVTTHFSFEYLDDPELTPITIKITGYIDRRGLENIAKAHEFIVSSNKGFEVIGVFFLTVGKALDWQATTSSETRIYPIEHIPSFLQDSTLLPDESPLALRRVLLERYGYPSSDFLYFSAVTITTVGYGDILPNSSRVRKLVMSESLAGVVIIGLCISFAFAAFSTPSTTQLPHETQGAGPGSTEDRDPL